jgi:hypothetical protein
VGTPSPALRAASPRGRVGYGPIIGRTLPAARSDSVFPLLLGDSYGEGRFRPQHPVPSTAVIQSLPGGSCKWTSSSSGRESSDWQRPGRS